MIDIRFVCGFDFISWLISWFSAGWFSHVDAVVPPGGVLGTTWKPGSLVGERSDTIGGKPPGLQCRPFGYEKVKRAVVFHLPAKPEQEQAFWAFQYSQETKAYDKEGILAFLFNTNWHKPGTYFCSADILDALQSADLIPPLYSDFSKITPVALANLISAIPGVKWEEEVAA